MLRTGLFLAMMLLLANLAVAAEEKIDAKLLIGKWEYQKLPHGLKITVEFTKDNKVKYVAGDENNLKTLEGSYKVEGDMLTIKILKDNLTTTKVVKIIKLTKTECTNQDDERQGEQSNMKKVP